MSCSLFPASGTDPTFEHSVWSVHTKVVRISFDDAAALFQALRDCFLLNMILAPNEATMESPGSRRMQLEG
jgi:hypothetical protein